MQRTTKWLLVGGALGGTAWFIHAAMQRFFVISFLAVRCREPGNCRGSNAWNYWPTFIDGFFTYTEADAYARKSTGSKQDIVIVVGKTVDHGQAAVMSVFAKGAPIVPMTETIKTLQSGGVTSFDIPTLKEIRWLGGWYK